MEEIVKRWDDLTGIELTYGEIFSVLAALTLFCTRELGRGADVLPSHLSLGRKLIETLLETFGESEFPPNVREAWEMFLKFDGCGEMKH